MEIGGASIRWRWYAAAGALAWMAAGLGGCGSSSKGGTGGAGGHGGATGGAGGHGGAGGAIDSGAIDARGGADGGVGDASDGRVDAPPVVAVSFTFDTDLNGFDIDPNPTTNPVNLGAIAADGGAPVTATFDGSIGMPAPGSAHFTATFSDYNQVIAFRHVYANNTQMIDLTGATLTARVRLDPGADGGATTFTGGVARIYALSTPTTPGFFLAEGGTVALNDNNWHTMTFHLTAAEFIDPNFDPTKVVQIGVHIATPPPVAPDAAVPPYGAAQPISVHIDTLTSN
jgi:hypothetical protein